MRYLTEKCVLLLGSRHAVRRGVLVGGVLLGWDLAGQLVPLDLVTDLPHLLQLHVELILRQVRVNEGLLAHSLRAMLTRVLLCRRRATERGLLLAALECKLQLGGFQPLLVVVQCIVVSDTACVDQRLGLPADLDLGCRLLDLVVHHSSSHVRGRALLGGRETFENLNVRPPLVRVCRSLPVLRRRWPEGQRRKPVPELEVLQGWCWPPCLISRPTVVRRLLRDVLLADVQILIELLAV